MSTTPNDKQDGTPAVHSSDLLAALNHLRAGLAKGRYPYVELFGDGSGRLMVGGHEWAEFENLADAVAKIHAANSELSGGGPLSNETTEAESRHPLE